METHDDDDLERLARLVDGIRFAMVTLPDAAGDLRGRPLTVQELQFDGSFWFLVSRSSEWVREIGAEAPANAAFCDPGDQRWVSVTGTARLVEDRRRIEDMWNPMYQAWFESADDPDLALLCLDVTTADYWDADTNKLVRWARMAKAAVTGDGADVGERGAVHPGR